MARGRPVYSPIRQNMVELLFFLKKAHGYKIFKVYQKVFPKCTSESIYYHLRKGTALGEFKVAGIEKQKGNYSWGPEAERIYYELGPNARPSMDTKLKKKIEES